MSLTPAEYEKVFSILAPLKGGRTEFVYRRKSALGSDEFYDELVRIADREGYPSFEKGGYLLLMRPGTAAWRTHPFSIDPTGA